MLSLGEQIHLSSVIARRLIQGEPDFNPLEAWHMGLETVRLQETDADETEAMLEISAISYKTVLYARQHLLADTNPQDTRRILEESADVMNDLTKNHKDQARRCGGYLLTAPSLGGGSFGLILVNDRISVSDEVKAKLAAESPFDFQQELSSFWRVATELTSLGQI